MNYLAHLFLAQRTHYSLLGNLMGDFVRDVRIEALPQEVQLGIKNHKEVDRFTDSHASVKQLKKRFSRERRRFAGIVLDVTFDYFLAKHWAQFSRQGFQEFIDYCYSSLRQQQHLMPARMRNKVNWMISSDLLGTYTTLDGIDRSLNGISARMRFENRLKGAIEEVVMNYHEVEKVFLDFFQELRDYLIIQDIETGKFQSLLSREG